MSPYFNEDCHFPYEAYAVDDGDHIYWQPDSDSEAEPLITADELVNSVSQELLEALMPF